MAATTHVPPATSLRDAYRAFDPKPLESGDPYFVDLTKARDSRAAEKLRDTIEFCEPGHAAIAFAGHRGSGKSTELLSLLYAMRHLCFGIYLDIIDYLDASDLQYTDLFLLVARRVLDELREAGIKLSSGLLKDVEKWFCEVTKETEETVEFAAGVSTEASARAEIPFIARLLAKLTADIKVGSTSREKTREELDHYFSTLVSYVNALVADASSKLKDRGRPSSILILLDNLDRVPSEKSEQLVFAHGSELQSLPCHVVFTISIDTYYSAKNIGTAFPHNLILPNVKLRKGKSDAGRNEEGIRALLRVIERRMDIKALLEPPELAKRAVELSGGSVRQLMRIMGEAILSASSRKLNMLDAEAIEDGGRALRQEFQRILTPEDYKLLARTHESKEIDKSEPYMQLLRNVSILEYNGKDVWHDVNPLIEPIDAFQRAWSALASSATT
ncbi:MAG TPA: hypothetical protein VMT20_08630 [Terriglobia bacterium]|nr:hypothetical protein [Terriglobia bacterium]